MKGINSFHFVFYYREQVAPGEKENTWLVSQPITLGEIIEGDVELELSDESTLPFNDIDWSNVDMKVVII